MMQCQGAKQQAAVMVHYCQHEHALCPTLREMTWQVVEGTNRNDSGRKRDSQSQQISSISWGPSDAIVTPCCSVPACVPACLRRTLNVLMHGMEALAALHRMTSDDTVLQRLLELLDILCSRLQREQGLLYEAYLPGADGELWQPAPGQVVLYGEWNNAGLIAIAAMAQVPLMLAARSCVKHALDIAAAAAAAVVAADTALQ
jgi:hypothetical protein